MIFGTGEGEVGGGREGTDMKTVDSFVCLRNVKSLLRLELTSCVKQDNAQNVRKSLRDSVRGHVNRPALWRWAGETIGAEATEGGVAVGTQESKIDVAAVLPGHYPD